eukprot:1422612-Prymnesium_polylepis.1
MIRELSMRDEAASLTRVRASLASACPNVLVPEPVEGLLSDSTLQGVEPWLSASHLLNPTTGVRIPVRQGCSS